MEEKKNRKFDSTKLKIVVVLILTVFVTSTVTYGFFNSNKRQTGKNEIMSGCFNVEMTNESASINIDNAYSMSDPKGQETTPYSFTITNTCDIDAAYYLVIDTKNGSFGDAHINVSVDKNQAQTLSTLEENVSYPDASGAYSSSHIVEKGTLAKDASKTFDIRLWINAATTYEDVQGKTWEGQVRVVNVVKDVVDATGPASQTLSSLNLEAKSTVPNFAEPATTDEGIFKMDDDYGISYYYRGAVTNNYVKFAGFYWRIVRINGDGSLRIIYDGTRGYENGANDSNRFIKTEQVYNTNYDDAKYVGWMYGPSGTTASTSKTQAQMNTESSAIKMVVDEWYKTNIVDAGYSGAVADMLFCNDRSMGGSDSTYTNLGYGTNPINYAARSRFDSSAPGYVDATPTFKCAQKNDAFTVEDTAKGNGALDYPVGLITADEIVAAGSGKHGIANSSYYLYRPSNWYWSLSPYFMYPDGGASVFLVFTDGLLGNGVYNSAGGVAPVINLSAEYVSTLIGTGSMSDPFRASDVTP